MTDELRRADDGAWLVGVTAIDVDGLLAPVLGRNRLLTVVDGPVLGLDVDGESHVLEPHRPFALPGGAAVVASVPQGSVRALDVLTSAEIDAFVTVLELGRTSTLPLAADQLAYVLKGSEAGSLVAGPAELAGRCTVAVITLERASIIPTRG